MFRQDRFNEDGKIGNAKGLSQRRDQAVHLRAYRTRRLSIIKKESDFRGAGYLKLSRSLFGSGTLKLTLLSPSLFLSLSLFPLD